MADCARCSNNPCTCVEAARPKRNWLIQRCAMPGCSVVIRVLPGEQDELPRCKWHQNNTAYYAQSGPSIPVIPALGPSVTLEEFGSDLFDAIKTNAALIQARRKIETYHCKGKVKAEHEAKAAAALYEKKLNELLPKIANPDDVRRILAMR